MKLFITGGKGMLGRTLQRRFWDHEVFVADLPEVDMLDKASLEKSVRDFSPDCIIHCAAMTRVDDCEANRDLAFRLNRDGSANVAEAAALVDARLIAISTDYVFSGDRAQGGYLESDEPAPRTVYGESKLAGEKAVLARLPSAVVLRIAWLYGAGGPSFIHTMARLGAQDGQPLKVVNDQRGNPTSTDAVADAIAFLFDHPEVHGIVHGTCSGTCTWYDLTVELFRILGLSRAVVPCTTAEFPRPAPRPANSALEKTVLESLGFKMPDWRDALATFAAVEFRT